MKSHLWVRFYFYFISIIIFMFKKKDEISIPMYQTCSKLLHIQTQTLTIWFFASYLIIKIEPFYNFGWKPKNFSPILRYYSYWIGARKYKIDWMGSPNIWALYGFKWVYNLIRGIWLGWVVLSHIFEAQSFSPYGLKVRN